jgi:hypothetical protein
MATQDYAASIQGVSIRVTRLDANGNLLNGAGDSYTTSAFMRVSFTPEYEEGDEITEKSANGSVCVTYKSPDTLKRITMELAICEPDPELTNLISGGLLLRKNLGTFASPDRKSVGWASPAVGDDPAGNGVAIEVWSLAIKDGKKAATLPYFHWVFPYAKLRQSGDRVIENGLMANTFEGYGLGNINFGDGIDDRWEFPTAAERPYSYARAAWAPTGRNGFYTWHGVLTNTITNKARLDDIATFTTGSAHGFVAGEKVTLTGGQKTVSVTAVSATSGSVTYTAANTYAVGDVVTVTGVTPSGYSGTFTIASRTSTDFVVANATTGTATLTLATASVNTLAGLTGGLYEIASASGSTFTVRIPGDDITSAAVSPVGTADVAPDSRSVTQLPDANEDLGTYNVPGNTAYNADNDIDFVINSSEDPSV